MSEDDTGVDDNRLPRLVVITIDFLSAWMLPAYGATWVAAGRLDALAAEGVVFDRVLAPSLDPRATREPLLPSLAACGDRDPGGRGEVVEFAEPDAAAEAVREGRARVVACHLDHLGRAWRAPGELRERYRDAEDLPAMEGCDVPDFAVDAGTDPDLVNVVRQAYAAEVTLLDHLLEELLDAPAGSPHPWTIVVAGTSGMPLGLHGQVGLERRRPACIPAYGERAHLPVIVRDASGRMAGQRFPGLLAAADIGEALASDEGPVAEFFRSGRVMPRACVRVEGEASMAVATADWHLVARSRTGTAITGAESKGGETVSHVELFHKPEDYFEVNDVADRCPEEVERLLAMGPPPSV